jgi:lipopolysaccharide/colanic/teichoic acid biosynthesis glycosyltransferase
MNPSQSALVTAGLAVDHRPAESAAKAGRSRSRLYAVPVRGGVRSSGWPVAALYRCFEVLVASIMLVLALPLLLIVAVVIRCDSPGRALFFHMRPGRSKIVHGRDLEGRADVRPPPGGFEADRLYYVPTYFPLVKFRTMYNDARARFPEYYNYKFEPGEFHSQYPTVRDDPRVTRIGKLLRQVSIDELPNLWSVLAGNLRLVGPRPEAPEVLQYYSSDEMYKFSCKPGITGLAQINGRGLLNWGETLAWDLEYVRTRSVALDLKILFMTLVRVSTRHGAF